MGRNRQRYAQFGRAIHWRNKFVAPPRYGFDESRLFGGIAEGFSQPVHRRIEAMLEIDKGVARPEPAMQLLPTDQVSRLFQQNGQDLKRLALQPDFRAVAVKLPGL